MKWHLQLLSVIVHPPFCPEEYELFYIDGLNVMMGVNYTACVMDQCIHLLFMNQLTWFTRGVT